jgi:hypothetical protein
VAVFDRGPAQKMSGTLCQALRASMTIETAAIPARISRSRSVR